MGPCLSAMPDPILWNPMMILNTKAEAEEKKSKGVAPEASADKAPASNARLTDCELQKPVYEDPLEHFRSCVYSFRSMQKSCTILHHLASSYTILHHHPQPHALNPQDGQFLSKWKIVAVVLQSDIVVCSCIAQHEPNVWSCAPHVWNVTHTFKLPFLWENRSIHPLTRINMM